MALNISEVSICNSALIKLGVDTITGLTQDTKNARLCNARYAYLRNETLESHPWSFAKKTVELADSGVTPDMDWQYQFPLPADYLSMIRGEDDKQDYEVFDGYLYANESPIIIKYLYENTNTATYSYIFAECLAWRIAADLAYAITNSREVSDQMMKLYVEFTKSARFRDSAGQRSPVGPVVDSFIDVRN